MPAMQLRLFPLRRLPPHWAELPATVCVWALFGRFMFVSVMFDPLITSTPLLVLFWIVPPLPAVVPVPVTVNEPLTLLSFTPFTPPADETLVSDMTRGVVPIVRVISTAVELLLVMAPLVVDVVGLLKSA